MEAAAAILEVTPVCTCLLVVDVQYDFLPGGSLEVKTGDEILEPVSSAMGSDDYDVVVATQDWHPDGHISFASSHDGRDPMETIELYGHDQILWPDHCVQGSKGARLHEDLPRDRCDLILRKGMDPESDSYSAFRNNWNPDGDRPPTGLAGYLRERGVDRVVVCGLARDVCVKWTAEDCVEAGFGTVLLWDLTRSVDPDQDEKLRKSLQEKGVDVRDSGRQKAAG